MKKLLTLLLVAALAVASFGVLTACKKDGGETTTSDTLEGEWYYTIEDFFAVTAESSGQDSTDESSGPEQTPAMPKISVDISFSIKKLTDEEKAFFAASGESTEYNYICLEIVKYNLAAATMTEAEKAMIGEIFGEPAGDGNIYAIFPYPFVEKANGEYNDDDFGEVVTSVVYKDSKLHVVLSFGAEADWNYRALGANPDVAGTWTGTDGTDPVSVTAVTAGEGKNTMFVGKYAIICDPEATVGWDDMSILFAAADGSMILNDCEGTSIAVEKAAA